MDIKKQLWENQLWETVGFVAKAAFLFLLTPIMIQKWGANGYGEFALASSLVVFVSMVDLGVRGNTRVQLSYMHSDGKHPLSKLEATRAVFSVLGNTVVILVGVTIFTILELPQKVFGISESNRYILLITTFLSSLVLLLSLCGEPLVARGYLGEIKLALAMGSVLAIPSTWWIVNHNGGPVAAIVVWQASLLIGLLLVLIRHRVWNHYAFTKTVISLHIWRKTVSPSLWFHAITMTGIGKTHGITLLISMISGTTTAGVFFVLLRLAEIISSLGAVSAEILLNALPFCKSSEARKQCIQTVNKTSLILGGCGALAMVAAGPTFLSIWLKQPPSLGWATGIFAAIYGLSTAFRQTTCNALTGLGRIRFSAKVSLLEGIIALLGTVYFQSHYGLGGTLSCLSLSALACLPSAAIINRECAASWTEIWIWPWKNQFGESARPKKACPPSNPGTR